MMTVISRPCDQCQYGPVTSTAAVPLCRPQVYECVLRWINYDLPTRERHLADLMAQVGPHSSQTGCTLYAANWNSAGSFRY